MGFYRQYNSIAILLGSTILIALLGCFLFDASLSNILRFFSLQDPSVRIALLGCTLLGINCGLLGSFLVVRKMALLGDTLSHAVLPGVALGFIVSMEKNAFTIFIGASTAGLFSAFLINWIKHKTRIREDSILGMVLASFYAIGICLITRIQNMQIEDKSGIHQYLFGQASAISEQDIGLMGLVCFLVIITLLLFYKELLALSFDPAFSQSAGIPIRWINFLLMALLTFSIVTSLQATGAILVVAMLITPAVTAHLLTNRFHLLLIIAALIGIISGISGAFTSFMSPHLPTGPLMIISATCFFTVAILFSPRRGIIPQYIKHYNQSKRIENEDALKACFYILENQKNHQATITYKQLATERNKTIPAIRKTVQNLIKKGWAQKKNIHSASFNLTPTGWDRACQLIRNHRLWELYLTHAADYKISHVHEDAEQIEHLLGDDVVKQLEERLDYPEVDPHGSEIPQVKRQTS